MRGWKKYRVGLILLMLGTAMAVLGALRGEQDTVFMKAINICLECIGIG